MPCCTLVWGGVHVKPDSDNLCLSTVACRTSRYFVKKVRDAADSSATHKKLMPYSPNAPRNRPQETVSVEFNTASSCHVTSYVQLS